MKRDELIDPRDGHPLRLTTQVIDSSLQNTNGLFNIVIDNAQIEKVTVVLFEELTFTDETLQTAILFMKKKRRRLKSHDG